MIAKLSSIMFLHIPYFTSNTNFWVPRERADNEIWKKNKKENNYLYSNNSIKLEC